MESALLHQQCSIFAPSSQEALTGETRSSGGKRRLLFYPGRVVNGSPKMISLNRSVRCINPLCPAVQQGRATKNRDTQAAMAIGLAVLCAFYRTKRPRFHHWIHSAPQTPPVLSDWTPPAIPSGLSDRYAHGPTYDKWISAVSLS